MKKLPFKVAASDKARTVSENEYVLSQLDRARKAGYSDLAIVIRKGVIKRVVFQETIE